MKKVILFCMLISSVFDLKASDTLNSNSNQNKRYTIGISFSLVSYTYWTNTDSLMLIYGGTQKPSPITRTLFHPFGFSFGYIINKNITFQTGVDFTENNIHELGDAPGDPRNGSGQNIYFTYKARYFQLPLMFTFYIPQPKVFYTQHKASFFFGAGIKNNFIYYERLKGKTNMDKLNTSPTSVDIINNNLKFTSIVPSISVGGIFWCMERKLGINYYGSFDFLPIYKKDNTLCDFPFHQFSIINLKFLYSF